MANNKGWASAATGVGVLLLFGNRQSSSGSIAMSSAMMGARSVDNGGLGLQAPGGGEYRREAGEIPMSLGSGQGCSWREER